MDFPLNDDPEKGWTVGINAPVLPEPFAPKSRRKANPKVDDEADYEGRKDYDFDEGKDPASGNLPVNSEYGEKFGIKGHDEGSGNTEAALDYEINARIKLEQAAGRLGKDADSVKKRTEKFLKENPNATDHSTITGNAMHAAKAIAYDVAIGWVNPTRITEEYLDKLRKFADWRHLLDNPLDTLNFKEYTEKGFFNGHQLFRTYDMKHMKENAPQIVDKREDSFVGFIS